MASLYQRADGRWCGQIIVETPQSKKKRKTVYGSTKREVEQKLVLLSAQQQTEGMIIDDNNTPFETFANNWLQQNYSLRDTTWSRYEIFLRLHINPTIGQIKLGKLRPSHLATLYSDKRKTLAPRTVLHMHRLIHQILEVAVRWNLINRNPAKQVDTPRAEKAEITPLTLEQVKAFLETARYEPEIGTSHNSAHAQP